MNTDGRWSWILIARRIGMRFLARLQFLVLFVPVFCAAQGVPPALIPDAKPFQESILKAAREIIFEAGGNRYYYDLEKPAMDSLKRVLDAYRSKRPARMTG